MKKRVTILCLLAILLLFTPVYFAHAVDLGSVFGSIGGTIMDGVRQLIETAIIGLLSAFIAVTALILEFTASILGYVMGQDFNGRILTQPFVQEGNAIVRDFANMFFIVILIIIAFATILRQEQFGIRRTLPILIIIALFINFSLIFVGFFIDISQVFMLYFLEPFDDIDFGTMLVNSTNFDKVFTSNPANTSQMNDWEELGIRIVIKALQLFALLFAIFVVAVLAVLFIIRTVILWTVAILAPLAFVAYILPFSRSMWTKWLSTLINWVLFGPAAMFFLFLAGKLMMKLQETGPNGMADFAKGATAGITRQAAGGNEFLGHGTAFIQAAAVFIFLFLAINSAKSFTGSIGAKVAGKVEGYGRGALGVVTAPPRAAGRAAVRGAKRKAMEEAAKRGVRPAGWGARTAEQIAAGEHPLGKLPLGLGWAARTAARQTRQPLREFEARAGAIIDQKEKDAGSLHDEGAKGAFKAAREPMERVARYRNLRHTRGMTNQEIGVSDDEAIELMREAKKYNRNKELDKTNVHLMPKAYGWNEEIAKKLNTNTSDPQVQAEVDQRVLDTAKKFSTADWLKISAEDIKKYEILQKAMISTMRSGQAAGFVQNGTTAQVEAFEYAVQNLTKAAGDFDAFIEIITKTWGNSDLAKGFGKNPSLTTLDLGFNEDGTRRSTRPGGPPPPGGPGGPPPPGPPGGPGGPWGGAGKGPLGGPPTDPAQLLPDDVAGNPVSQKDWLDRFEKAVQDHRINYTQGDRRGEWIEQTLHDLGYNVTAREDQRTDSRIVNIG